MASAASCQILEKFLDTVFNGMVLCLGIEEMTNIRNPERLKRELRITHKLLDKLFECLECGDRGGGPGKGPSHKSSAGDVIEFVETILCQVINKLNFHSYRLPRGRWGSVFVFERPETPEYNYSGFVGRACTFSSGSPNVHSLRRRKRSRFVSPFLADGNGYSKCENQRGSRLSGNVRLPL